ncbi:hypothetical protein EBZ57_02890 [bacterium]|nr:hypothetical protein [bacterium]
MKNRIRILKGKYNRIRISDCVFTLLKPLDITKGKVTAIVDASELLGPEYAIVAIDVEDYKLID